MNSASQAISCDPRTSPADAAHPTSLPPTLSQQLATGDDRTPPIEPVPLCAATAPLCLRLFWSGLSIQQLTPALLWSSSRLCTVLPCAVPSFYLTLAQGKGHSVPGQSHAEPRVNMPNCALHYVSAKSPPPQKKNVTLICMHFPAQIFPTQIPPNHHS